MSDQTEDLKKSIVTGKVLVDFFATWCGPCYAVEPIIKKIAEEAGLPLIKVDIDVEREIAETFGILSVPTIVYMENREEVARVTGALPKAKLTEALGL